MDGSYTEGSTDSDSDSDDSTESGEEREKGGKLKQNNPPKKGMLQDTYTLPGIGQLILQWPEDMTTDDIEEVEMWLDMMKKKLARAVRRKELDESE